MTNPATLDTLNKLAIAVCQLRDLIANTPRLHRKDLMLRYGISKSTLHRWLGPQGKLPKPVRFSGPLWKLSDLEAAEQAGTLPRPVST